MFSPDLELYNVEGSTIVVNFRHIIQLFHKRTMSPGTMIYILHASYPKKIKAHEKGLRWKQYHVISLVCLSKWVIMYRFD